MKKITITALVALGAMLGTAVALLHPPALLPQGDQSRHRLAVGPYEVIEESFAVTDPSRKTQSNGDFTGSSSRVLEGKLWRPASTESGPAPLLVYCHGFMSHHMEGTYLTNFFASHGYVVVAVSFPLTNYFAPGGPLVDDVIHQPEDVHFVIDSVLARNGKDGDSLEGRIDPQRIGVLGVSLGGLTTQLVSFHGRLRDPRSQGAVSIAGPSSMMNQKFFSAVDVPFMMIAGEADAIVPFPLNGEPIPKKDPDSVLIGLKGASHTAFAGIAAYIFRWLHNPDTVACANIEKTLKAKSNPADYLGALVSEKFGITPAKRVRLCTDIDQIPRTMRPGLQHSLTTVATFSFFESLFSQDASKRRSARRFLVRDFGAENPEVTVTAGNYGITVPAP